MGGWDLLCLPWRFSMICKKRALFFLFLLLTVLVETAYPAAPTPYAIAYLAIFVFLIPIGLAFLYKKRILKSIRSDSDSLPIKSLPVFLVTLVENAILATMLYLSSQNHATLTILSVFTVYFHLMPLANLWLLRKNNNVNSKFKQFLYAFYLSVVQALIILGTLTIVGLSK